ncbi:MAG: tRNA glutamyl-Q(34) synthetase GluQRS [Marinicaulis sp.]|nr:tRNA glutamyl-Q(34) synthetase GluQRS [Marinicaulis sp.]
MTGFVTRFAPSPTGYLHLGHAFSALVVNAAARKADGVMALRVEDIDQTRCRPEFEQAIYDDLSWLCLEWPKPVRRQSDHFDDYRAALQVLIDKRLVYRCFKTRKEIADEIARAPHLARSGPEGPQYSGAALPPDEEAARVEAGEAYAWRLSMAAARDHLGTNYKLLSFCEETKRGAVERPATPEIFGDAVIARKDAGTSYHLASVHDDALQGVTHVIRGEDLAAAAHLHCLLQRLLGYLTPVYRHHRLITGDDGQRLAKRNRSATLHALREAGVDPSEVRAQLGF